MGAGSSTEQQSPEQPAGSNTPSEPELSGHGPAAEEPGAAGEPADADPATKVPQKNGQLSAANGVAEQGDVHVQEGNQDGQEEEVVVEDVGQRESEDVREKDRTKEMAANSAVAEDITKDGQEETPEIIKPIPASENVVEDTAQPAEPQANDVGFKKVFKFVGFKFTVKKDKNEKPDPVQLLTVQKDEGAEATVGAGDHQEPGMETGESAAKESELKQSTEKPDTPKQAQSGTEEIPLQAESGQAAEEEAKDEGEEKQEEEPAKPAESPTSPASGETTSSFKKFFTHGWSGWRKKTSFKKPKEDELETSEKRKEQEAAKVEGENDKTEGSGQAPAPEQQEPSGDAHPARLSADYEKVELPLDDQVGGLEGASQEKCAPLATEVFDEKVEAQQEVVAEVHASTVGKMTGEQGVQGAEGDVEGTGESSPPEDLAEDAQEAPPQEAGPADEPLKSKEVCDSAGDHTQLTDLSPDDKALPKHPEGVVSEADLLSSQERIKAQGSPLKKLFSSSGLKKLSGKKQKGKRGGGGDEEPGEQQQAQAESPESSASSPEELEDTPCVEKGLPPAAEAQQEGEAEEGAASDGEKKREGITPWASFKKMVTPKKRVRRPSESDKEDEGDKVDKVKSATLSSTESAASEMQEEVKAVGDTEQKPEEPKRKVDTSVSWEALICVGSSKKRARKASSSDDEGEPRTVGGDGQKAEEARKDKEAGADAVPAAGSTEEHDPPLGSSSPEPAGSPSEGEGVSTWESFKRLVTPRKKSKSKLEEKTEEAGTEQLASDVEPSKEESWVSIKKFIPGRRKKRPDGKHEQATVEDVGPAEVHEDDPDVPAVVPLSEYDAVEREKMELRQAEESEEGPQLHGAVYVSEEVSKTLVHTVSVAVVDGTRAVTSAEERSPSWISASVTEPLEHAGDEATPCTEEVTEREMIAKEAPTVTQTLPEEGKDARDDAVISEVEFTSEAVTAVESTEALHAEEVTEASGAEETTDMVSAVSQLTDSPDTTEEATPVQEVEGAPDREEQERQTQAVLQAVAEKVQGDSQALAIQTVQRAGPKALEKVEEVEEDSEVLAVAGERDDVVLQEPVQGGEAEHSARGSEIGQSAPDSFETVPDVTADVELQDRVTTCQAVEPQQLLDQAVAPESSETLTDSETSGSTPLADSDTPDGTQQDQAVESQDSKAIAADGQSQVTEAEAVPAQEGPSVPPRFPPQEEHGGKPGREILEPTQVPDLAKTEVGQEAGHSDGEGVKEERCVEGLEGSAHTGGPDSLEKVAEEALDGDGMGAPECHEEEETEEVQSISPEETEVGTDVEKEKVETQQEQVSEEPEGTAAAPEHEETHPQPTQTDDASDSEEEREASSLEGNSSLPDQDKAGCIEVQVQSSDPPVTPRAVPVREVAEEVKISEADESLERVGAHLIPAEKSSKKGESQAESGPGIASPAPESTLHSDPHGEIGASRKHRSDDEDDEQVDGPDGKESAERETDAAALELQSESTKLVQNIIQTAVDQFTRTETAPTACPPDSLTQVPVMQADSQGAQQMLDKEESRHQASAQEEAAQEGLALTDISQGMNEPSEKVNTLAAEIASVKDQQCERLIVPLGAEGDGDGAKPVPSDDCAKLGEGVEKLPPESKDPKGHAADGPQHQSSAQAEVDASGNLTKESPDANGPKLTEEGDAREVGIQEGKTHTEIKPQTEEDLREPEGDLAES